MKLIVLVFLENADFCVCKQIRYSAGVVIALE